MIKNIVGLTRIGSKLLPRNINLFAKQKGDKPQKSGGKKDEGGMRPHAPPQPTPQQLLKKYLTTHGNTLSPKQQQIMNEGFNDLSQQQKMMLNGFAEQIIDLTTPVFLEFRNWGGLGTSKAYYMPSQLPPSGFQPSIKYLKKQDS